MSFPARPRRADNAIGKASNTETIAAMNDTKTEFTTLKNSKLAIPSRTNHSVKIDIADNEAIIKKNLGQQGKDFQVLFVTLDPERDSQSLLKQYVPSFDASFIGLTGTKDQIKKIAQQYKIFHQKVGDGKSYTIDHSSAIYLLDKDGMIRVRYPYGSSVKGMIEDIKHLISV